MVSDFNGSPTFACLVHFAETQKWKLRQNKYICNLCSTVDSKKQTNKFSQKTKHEEHTTLDFYIYFPNVHFEKLTPTDTMRFWWRQSIQLFKKKLYIIKEWRNLSHAPIFHWIYMQINQSITDINGYKNKKSNKNQSQWLHLQNVSKCEKIMMSEHWMTMSLFRCQILFANMW